MLQEYNSPVNGEVALCIQIVYIIDQQYRM